MTTEHESEFDTALRKLQVRLVDAANGYDEGVKLTKSAPMRQLFDRLAAEHRAAAEDVSRLLVGRGIAPRPDGSWFTLVHDTVMNFRALFTGLKEDALAPIADGEGWLLQLYDDAIGAADPSAELPMLTKQRAQVSRNIAELKGKAKRAAA